VPGPYEVTFYSDGVRSSQIEEWLSDLEKGDKKLWANVIWLLKLLREYGPSLQAPYAKWNIYGPISELRKRYRHHYIRIYFWQRNETVFVIAAGELKKTDSANQSLLKYALEAYEEQEERR